MYDYHLITRTLVGLSLLLLNVVIFADETTIPNKHADESLIVWRDVAPSLAGLREANPEVYNTMADGTYDNFTADERATFVDELTLKSLKEMGHSDNGVLLEDRDVGIEALEALIERRRESRQSMRESMRRHPQWFQEAGENILVTQDLHEIQEYDRLLQLEQRYREGDPELLKTIHEDMARTADELSVLYQQANEMDMDFHSARLDLDLPGTRLDLPGTGILGTENVIDVGRLISTPSLLAKEGDSDSDLGTRDIPGLGGLNICRGIRNACYRAASNWHGSRLLYWNDWFRSQSYRAAVNYDKCIEVSGDNCYWEREATLQNIVATTQAGVQATENIYIHLRNNCFVVFIVCCFSSPISDDSCTNN